MHWQEACLRSEDRKAKRIHHGKLIIRRWDGSADIETDDGSWQIAVPSEIEGYDDWSPVAGGC